MAGNVELQKHIYSDSKFRTFAKRFTKPDGTLDIVEIFEATGITVFPHDLNACTMRSTVPKRSKTKHCFRSLMHGPGWPPKARP